METIDIIYIVFAFIFGSCIGSFLNVVIYRSQTGESVVHGNSHCMTCGERIKAIDLIPIFSWLFLRGKCRFCSDKISPRYMLVEALTGWLFALAMSVYSPSYEFYVGILLFSFLICLSFIDIDIMEIPYWATISIAVLGIINIVTQIVVYNQPLKAVIFEALIGAICISLPFALLAFFGGMGGGDVQLMAASGLLLGFKIIPAALIGIILGAIYGVYLKIRQKGDNKWTNIDKSKKINTSEKVAEVISQSDEIEVFETLTAIDESTENHTEDSQENSMMEMVFGPFLSIGIVICYLWGNQIISNYMGTF